MSFHFLNPFRSSVGLSLAFSEIRFWSNKCNNLMKKGREERMKKKRDMAA
jgi:hypothetical protein